MTRPPRLTLLFAILGAACGAPPPTSPTTPSHADEAPAASPAAPQTVAPSLSSFTLDAAVAQRLPRSVTPALVHPVPGGGLVVTSPSGIALADRSLTVVREDPFPVHFDDAAIATVDPDGPRLVAPTFVLDLVNGEFHPRLRPHGRTEDAVEMTIGCDPTLARCLRSSLAWPGFRIVVTTIDGAPDLPPVVVPEAAFAEVLPSGDRRRRSAMFARQAFVEAERAVIVLEGTPPRLCTIALLSGVVERCSAIQSSDFVGFDRVRSQVVVASPGSVERYDASTLASVDRHPIATSLLQLSEDGALLVVEDATGGLSVVDTHDHAELASYPAAARRVSLGTGGRFLVRVGDVYELRRGPELVGRMQMSPRQEPDYGTTRVLETPIEFALWGDEGVIVVDTWNGWARFVDGSVDVRFSGPVAENDFAQVEVVGNRLVVGTRGLTRLGADGITIRTPTDAADEEAVILRAFPTYADDGIVAEGFPGSSGPAFAYLSGRELRFADRNGIVAGSPIALARSIRAESCEQLQFVSEVEVAIHGPAPCVPSRAHATTGAVSPLGRAYVGLATTPDRRRTMMLANRVVELLDGRSGASIGTFDPRVDHPRSVAISTDGTRGVVFGTEDYAAFEFRAPEGGPFSATEIVRVSSGWQVGYVPDADRVFGCFEGRFRSSNPRDGSDDRRIPAHACADSGRPVGFTFLGGVVAGLVDDRLSLVRLRDGALLELRLVARHDGFALAVARRSDTSEGLVGLFPDGTSAFVVVDPATRRPVPVAPSGDAAHQAIREFFAPP